MVQRPRTSRFMPSTWVFPGGAIDGRDAGPPAWVRADDDWHVAALRETAEEVGLWITTDGVVDASPEEDVFSQARRLGMTLDGAALVYFSNWVTPEVFPIRFDTRFFLAVAGADVEGRVDGDELVDLAWISPLDALRREELGEWDVAFPTRKTLELLATEPTARALADRLVALDAVPPVQPRLFVSESEARIVLPDDPLYDAVAADQADPDILARLASVIARGGHVPAEFKRQA